ncbi:E3 ubiquitin-protein ligase SINAT2 [Capsicum chinense]|nr:E3 ubiquitin-protein ligase SINAT2 [Capsicum chinense]
MDPGGSNYQDIGDSRSAYTDYGIALQSAEFTNTPFRESTAVIDGKHGAGSNSAVHEMLKCAACMNLMYPPIYQCPNGHALCEYCKSKVLVCPICCHEPGNIRCLALEKIAESLELPCRYQFYGCQDIFPYHTRLQHEQNCRFRPYNCPYAESECAVTGDIHKLVAHLKDHHKVDMHDGCVFKHRYDIPNPQEVDNAAWMLRVFNCFDHQFCLHFEAFNLGLAPVYIAFIRFMGDDDDATRFRYSLEVGGFGRKLTWQGVPRSIHFTHKTVRDSLDGLIIHRSMALFFSGGDMKELKLQLVGRIWPEPL